MGESRLKRLGYWRGTGAPDLPEVSEFVDTNWDERDRAEAWSYLRSGFVARAYMGPSFCRICGIKNGSLELSDGAYIWPEGLAHYVREHSVRLPKTFVEHLRARINELETASVDEYWWLTAAADHPRASNLTRSPDEQP